MFAIGYNFYNVSLSYSVNSYFSSNFFNISGYLISSGCKNYFIS